MGAFPYRLEQVSVEGYREASLETKGVPGNGVLLHSLPPIPLCLVLLLLSSRRLRQMRI